MAVPCTSPQCTLVSPLCTMVSLRTLVSPLCTLVSPLCTLVEYGVFSLPLLRIQVGGFTEYINTVWVHSSPCARKIQYVII
jgi:hypothetical protein